ncbi:MAG: efflux RND transporter periplasmic adaptor subunit [Myxococcales bacterium]|nr:efflux RND transporter periplasmic adaptor subunit [Myxococcales bacterium]
MSEIEVHAPDPEPIPKGVRAMSIVRWVLIALTALAALGSWWSFARADGQAESAAKYYCPMHPEVTSASPGECPICQMTLEPIPEDRRKTAAAPSSHPPHVSPPAASAPPGTVWTCPMDPEVISPAPGRCPKCKMRLEPKAPPAQAGPSDHAGHAPDAGPSHAPDAGAPPTGIVPIELSLDRLQAIGVRTAVAVETPTSGSVRIAAGVEAPESGVAQVHVRAPGFVEHIAVRETGVRVRRGQNLLSIYSPEIYQAESELLAVKDWPNVGGGKSSGDRARRKLELLGMSNGAIDQLLKKAEPSRTVGIGAPISGFVTQKNVVLGSYVAPETVLYEIVDLSKVYVVASVFQRELGLVQVGSEGKFSAPGLAAPVVAKVDLIYPRVDAEARTTRVRFSVKNPDMGLRPGQYGWVELSQAARTVVAVPRDALIDTGLERYVFVQESPGRFAPRTVEVGVELGTDRVELTAGVRPGESVVSGATFLLDSESRLKASLAGKGAAVSQDHSKHGTP